MKLWTVILLCALIVLMAGNMVSGENQSAENTTPAQSLTNITNVTPVMQITPQEKLMNLAFEARAFALEIGKNQAIAEFSSPSGQFHKDGMYIIAYAADGILLADSKRPGDIGSRFITDDHDSGQVRLMRDLASTGGGLFTDPKTGDFWFVSDVDGSWWICAATEKGAVQQI